MEFKVNTIQDKFVNGIKTIDEKRNTYIELLELKELIISTSIINLTNTQLELLDTIRFKVLEDLCFMEMDLRKYKGLNIEPTLRKLEKLYNDNRGDE